jgi:hypothetical protein
VQALAGAMCTSVLAVTGITNKSLRALMTGLLGGANTMNRASYDLARLRLTGLITRIPAKNRYRLTNDGVRQPTGPHCRDSLSWTAFQACADTPRSPRSLCSLSARR